MKKTSLFRILVLVSGLAAAPAALAHAEHAFPAKFSDFEKLTFAQMKDLPDLKWPLDKKATVADLERKNETELVLLRNSIYAQHGFGFSQKALANYFMGRSWYKRNAEADLSKLSKTSRESVAVFLKAQSTMNGGRAVASEENTFQMTQIAYNLFLMGFCTYDVGDERNAGMVVFEPGGVAKVFHSRASRNSLANYAYDEYAMPEIREYGQLLIEAKWEVAVNGSKGVVTIAYPQATVDAIIDAYGKKILDSAKRQVLKVNFGNGDYKPNLYPWVKTKKCTMTRMP